MKEIDRKCFMTLNRDNNHHNHYYVLNDGNYVTDFWADCDTDAVNMFQKGEY